MLPICPPLYGREMFARSTIVSLVYIGWKRKLAWHPQVTTSSFVGSYCLCQRYPYWLQYSTLGLVFTHWRSFCQFSPGFRHTWCEPDRCSVGLCSVPEACFLLIVVNWTWVFWCFPSQSAVNRIFNFLFVESDVRICRVLGVRDMCWHFLASSEHHERQIRSRRKWVTMQWTKSPKATWSNVLILSATKCSLWTPVLFSSSSYNNEYLQSSSEPHSRDNTVPGKHQNSHFYDCTERGKSASWNLTTGIKVQNIDS